MGSRVWSASEAVTYYTLSPKSTTSPKLKPISKTNPFPKLSPKTQTKNHKSTWSQKQSKRPVRVIVVEHKRTEDSNPMEVSHNQDTVETSEAERVVLVPIRTEQRLARKRSERKTYLVAAIMSSLGVSSAAIFAVYYRFHCQMQVSLKC